MKKIIGLFCFIILFVSCEKDIIVDNIWLDTTSLEMYVGDEYSLKTAVTPMEAKDKGLSWSSSNVSVATVNSYGKITAITAGSSTITVQSNDGGAFASCNVVVNIDTRPSYSLETEEILLQSFKIYKDEISVIYEKKKVIQTNPNATVTKEQIQQLQHVQDSIDFSKACCYNDQKHFEFYWYFPVTVKVNGQASSIEKYISYEPDYDTYDFNKENYEKRKHLIDTLDINTLIAAVSSAYLYGWCLSTGINYAHLETLTGDMEFRSTSEKDRYVIADRSVNPNVLSRQFEIESSLFRIPSNNINVENFAKTVYNLAYDRFNGRLYYDANGNKYLTEVSESTIDRIRDFNKNGVLDDLDHLRRVFPITGYVYPTIRFYKNDELVHETILLFYWEYFYYDPDKRLICTALEFNSVLLKDMKQIFFYKRSLNHNMFEYEIADYSTGKQVWSNIRIDLSRDEKDNEKGTISYE